MNSAGLPPPRYPWPASIRKSASSGFVPAASAFDLGVGVGELGIVIVVGEAECRVAGRSSRDRSARRVFGAERRARIYRRARVLYRSSRCDSAPSATTPVMASRTIPAWTAASRCGAPMNCTPVFSISLRASAARLTGLARNGYCIRSRHSLAASFLRVRLRVAGNRQL